jgi:hypothetical protein
MVKRGNLLGLAIQHLASIAHTHPEDIYSPGRVFEGFFVRTDRRNSPTWEACGDSFSGWQETPCFLTAQKVEEYVSMRGYYRNVGLTMMSRTILSYGPHSLMLEETV